MVYLFSTVAKISLVECHWYVEILYFSWYRLKVSHWLTLGLRLSFWPLWTSVFSSIKWECHLPQRVIVKSRNKVRKEPNTLRNSKKQPIYIMNFCIMKYIGEWWELISFEFLQNLSVLSLLLFQLLWGFTVNYKPATLFIMFMVFNKRITVFQFWQ